EVSVKKTNIKIGRPSDGSDVDIELKNGKVSRCHATLDLDDAENIWLMHKGQNPTKVNGLSCNFEEKRLVKPGQKIEIEDYVLIIKT
nr:FHA domain-containing protein [Pyrinomonadaceae bacterium]